MGPPVPAKLEFVIVKVAAFSVTSDVPAGARAIVFVAVTAGLIDSPSIAMPPAPVDHAVTFVSVGPPGPRALTAVPPARAVLPDSVTPDPSHAATPSAWGA